ncbi:MAG TPA: lysozyme inhibitor LprI family protein [Rhizomicrobium sp.]|jgi:uncharacterized protein YecT (DUF1311 family)|nr:lysozyme inhibitor LprI family protein [Rhizomicrobium sp.]
MFFPHFLTATIKGLTEFLPWPWNAPVTIALATLIWHGILRGSLLAGGWIDMEIADRERLAGRAPSERQRFAGDMFQSAVRYLILILWIGVGITLFWTPFAYYVSVSPSASTGWVHGFVATWAEIASPYLYPGESASLPVARGVPQGTVPAATNTASPSFDCAKANKWAEFQVCSSPDLAALDARMGALYLQLINPLPVGEARMPLRLEQRAWLAQRNQCQYDGDPITCLRQAYDRRISELQAKVAP